MNVQKFLGCHAQKSVTAIVKEGSLAF